MFPEAVDEDAGGQWVVAIDEPVGQIQPGFAPGGGGVGGFWAEEDGHGWFDDWAALIHPIASGQDADGAWFDVFGDEGFGAAGDDGVAFGLLSGDGVAQAGQGGGVGAEGGD